MTQAEGILASLGGLAAFVSLLWIVMRATAGRVRAIDENTDATRDLSESLDRLARLVERHETRISRLEGRQGIRTSREPR